MNCEIHKKYKGRRKPKHECVGCLSLYLLIKSKPRVQPMPTKVIPDKTKYNRKKKHRNQE